MCEVQAALCRFKAHVQLVMRTERMASVEVYQTDSKAQGDHTHSKRVTKGEEIPSLYWTKRALSQPNNGTDLLVGTGGGQ